MLLPFAARVFWNGTRLRKAMVSAVLGVFLVGPHWLFPNDHGREMYWSWWENIIGDTYMIVTLGFVVWSATARLRTPTKPGAGTGATTETSPRTAEDLLTARQRVASARPVASGAVVEP
jgi:alpha-1,2-mannosyltransferase